MIGFYREGFAKLLAQLVWMSASDIADMIDMAPSHIEWDLAFPCFQLAKELKKWPQQIAQDLEERLTWIDSEWIFEKFVAVGPYVNAVIAQHHLLHTVLSSVQEQEDFFGSRVSVVAKKIAIESPSPNTNKPLHLGHVRNMLLGNILAAVNKFVGHDVVKVEIVNDRGIHICKSMLAYKLFGQDKQPDKKSDHFVGDWYVRFAQESEKNPDLISQAQLMLQEWEAGDVGVRALWSMMNGRAEKGMKETYDRYWTYIDHAHYESDIYNYGKDIVLEWLEKWVFERDAKGNVVYVIDREKDQKIVLLRSDDTALYSTQDVALAKLRFDEYKMDAMIYVVGNEQSFYFTQLFEVFSALKYPFVKNCHHLAYGMIELPDGKMKSREGNVVDADTLADDVHTTALQQILERYPDINMDEAHQRAEAIALGAIKFAILKYDALKNFVFNKDESLSFEGETWPYLQYTFARASALLRRAREEWLDYTNLWSISSLSEGEWKALCFHLASFPETIKKISAEFIPNLLPKYLIELAHTFNSFYQNTKVFEWDRVSQEARLAIVSASRQVLKNGLKLMGIEAPEVM